MSIIPALLTTQIAARTSTMRLPAGTGGSRGDPTAQADEYVVAIHNDGESGFGWWYTIFTSNAWERVKDKHPESLDWYHARVEKGCAMSRWGARHAARRKCRALARNQPGQGGVQTWRWTREP